MFRKPAIAVVCILASGAATAPGVGRNLEFSADVGVARLDGTSYERVYTLIDHGPLNGRYHRLSELVWDLEGVYGVRASAAVELDRLIEVRASVFSALTEGSGGMVDYDWFLYDRPDFWTHRSRSTVDVKNAQDVDLRATLRVVRDRPVSLNAMLGWRYLNFEWKDRGIDYVYSSLGAPGGNPVDGYTYEQRNPFAVRDLADEDTRVGILYEQTFSIPYVGLGSAVRRGRLQAKAEILFSPIVTARDTDQHLLRNLRFEGDFGGGTYLAWKVALVHHILPHLFLTASYESQAIDEFRGDIEVSEIGGSRLGRLHNGASVEHASRYATIAVGGNF
jgi:plasminogen activator